MIGMADFFHDSHVIKFVGQGLQVRCCLHSVCSAPLCPVGESTMVCMHCLNLRSHFSNVVSDKPFVVRKFNRKQLFSFSCNQLFKNLLGKVFQ